MTRRFVAELQWVTAADGSTTTHYVSTSGFATRPTDTPPDTYVPGRLVSAGVVTRSLFSGGRVAGAARPDVADLIVANSDGALDAWVDYGVAGAKVTVRMGEEGAAYPAGYEIVWVAYVTGIRATLGDASRLYISARSRDYLLDRPVLSAGFAGTGGLEGTTAVAGRLKPWVSSDPGYMPPVLVDSALQLYYVQSTGAGGLQASFGAWSGGVPITRGSDYTSASQCTSTAPAAGQCRFWFGAGGSGPVYVRLDAAPDFDLRVYPFGHQSSGSSWTLPALAQQAGISGGSGSIAVGPILVDGEHTTYAHVMDDACAAQFGYYGMSRLDAFRCGVFDVPGETAVITLDQHNAWNWQREPVRDMAAPVWSIAVSAGDTWPSNLQASASETMADYLTREPVWCAFASSDAAVKTANPGALAETMRLRGRHFQGASQQTTFATGYFARFGARRATYQCTTQLTSAALAVDLADTVEIKLPRFALTTGKKMRVISQRIDCDQQSITFGLWG